MKHWKGHNNEKGSGGKPDPSFSPCGMIGVPLDIIDGLFIQTYSLHKLNNNE